MATVKHLKKSNIVIAAAIVFGLHSSAYANDASAELAAGLLAKSQAIDTKCKFLTSSEHDEISNLVARAEIALARRESIAATKAVMARNNLAGRNASCSASEHAEVSNILAAAKAAVSAAPVVVAAKPKPAMVRSTIILAQPKNSIPQAKPMALKPVSGLAQYATITERYYLARRCGNMSSRAITDFYQTVVSTHKQVLSSFGRRAVAGIMHESQSRAGTKSCS
jgi:hypothetical protein